MSKKNKTQKQQLRNLSLPANQGQVQPTGKPIQNPNQSTPAAVLHQQRYIGPLPPPSMLAEFDRVHPGIADRIVKMAEQGVEIQSRALRYSGRDRFLGQIFAFILGMTALCIGGFLVYIGKDIAGLISMLPGVAIVMNAVLSKSKSKKEPVNKGG